MLFAYSMSCSKPGFAAGTLPDRTVGAYSRQFSTLGRTVGGSSFNQSLKKAPIWEPFKIWCGRRDLNPHSHRPLPPQDSVSTNSTTSACSPIIRRCQQAARRLKAHHPRTQNRSAVHHCPQLLCRRAHKPAHRTQGHPHSRCDYQQSQRDQNY